MSKRTIGRLCALVPLTLTLLLASSARADAAQRLGPAGLWGWLENLWHEGIGVVARQEPPAPSRSGETPGFPIKQGGCLDPHGCPSTQSNGSSGGFVCGPNGCTGPNG